MRKEAGRSARSRRGTGAAGRAKAGQGRAAPALLHRDLRPRRGLQRAPARQRSRPARAGRRRAGRADGGAARGIAVHALLEWSQANGWQAPTAELVRRDIQIGGGRRRRASPRRRCWPRSRPGSTPASSPSGCGTRSSRAEVPLLIEVADTVLRGSIDLLVEEDGKATPDRRLQDRPGRRRGDRRARGALRDPAGDLRARRRRGARRRRRSSSPTSSWSAPRNRSLRGGEPGRDRGRPGERLEDRDRHGVRERLDQADAGRRPAGGAASSASSSSFSSFRPSPTASSSAAQ